MPDVVWKLQQRFLIVSATVNTSENIIVLDAIEIKFLWFQLEYWTGKILSCFLGAWSKIREHKIPKKKIRFFVATRNLCLLILTIDLFHRWDFTLHPVSVFSYRLLDQIWTFPVFRVSDLNAELYEKVRILRFAKLRRFHLKFVKDFITSCRFADELVFSSKILLFQLFEPLVTYSSLSLFDGIEKYLTNDTDLWSMTDFVAVRNGSFLKNITTIIAKCDEHIKECELCTARGFICELCPQKLVIFPWQPKIRRCNDCGACCHENCWQSECNKCQRLKKRQQSSGARKI